MSDKFPVQGPVSVHSIVVTDFLEGVQFTESLCDRLCNSYEWGMQVVSYKRTLEFVKTVLRQSRCANIGSDIRNVESTHKFTDLEMALLIRLTNLCHHNRRIIVVNGVIVYMPRKFRQLEEEKTRIYVYREITSYNSYGALSKLWGGLLNKFTLTTKRVKEKALSAIKVRQDLNLCHVAGQCE